MRIKMNKRDTHAHIIRRAEELAMSGDHDSYQSIEAVLVHREELPEARGILDSRLTRQHLDDLCRQAKACKTSKGSSGS